MTENRWTHVFRWKRLPTWAPLYRKPCRILARGKLNSRLLEFEDGTRIVTSGNSIQRMKQPG